MFNDLKENSLDISKYYQIYINPKYAKEVLELILRDEDNITMHYKDISEKELSKFNINDLVNLKRSSKYMKDEDNQQNSTWQLKNVYSFDILTTEAKELYDLLIGIINRDSHATSKGISNYRSKKNKLDKLEKELIEKLNSIDDSQTEKLCELKEYARRLKLEKDNTINKYYEMLFDFIDLSYIEKCEEKVYKENKK